MLYNSSMDSSRDSSMGSEEQVSRDERPFSFSETRAGSGDTQSISISSGVGSASVAQSRDSSGSSSEEVEEHRNMMLASLLEDYIRTRATDFLNSTNPSRNYTRQSPEVQTLARQLFADTSRKLSTSGIVSEFASSDAGRGTRRQYLTALDNLMAGSQGSATSLQSPVHDLGIDISHLSIVPHPGNDMHLTVQLPRPQSHYQSSFQELSLLGKGGFGKVYQCFNPLDQKTYAVKKIQLSPTLALRFRNGRLDKLQHILREVQALATLEHPNIVRYHATWFEEPQQPSRNVISHGRSFWFPYLLFMCTWYSHQHGIDQDGFRSAHGVLDATNTSTFHIHYARHLQHFLLEIFFYTYDHNIEVGGAY